MQSSILANLTELGMWTQVLAMYSVVVNANIKYLICILTQRRPMLYIL